MSKTLVDDIWQVACDSRGIYKELHRKAKAVASLLSTNAADTLWDPQFKLVHSKRKEPERRSGWEPGTCCKLCGLPQSLARVPLSCKLAVSCCLPSQMLLGQAVHTGERLADVVLLPGYPAVVCACESGTSYKGREWCP